MEADNSVFTTVMLGFGYRCKNSMFTIVNVVCSAAGLCPVPFELELIFFFHIFTEVHGCVEGG